MPLTPNDIFKDYQFDHLKSTNIKILIFKFFSYNQKGIRKWKS